MTETRVAAEDRGTEAEFETLLEFVRDSRGFDFTGYKRPSLKRRVARRMAAVGATEYGDYQQYLARNGPEFNELFNTILINVTAFFRDPPAWEFLGETIVPPIVQSSDGADEIRIWSAGCATGEEAYSLAMLFADALGEQGFQDRVKVYATDIDEEALTTARHGRYPASALENVSDERRERYFEEAGGGYVLKTDLRRCVVFGRNDLIVDPPISRIGLVSARNTLMYFSAETQRKILANFHFALDHDGYLFLGRSEMLLSRSALFEPVDAKRRVFAKIPQADFRDGLREMAQPTPPRERTLKTSSHRIREASFDTGPVAQLLVDTEGTLGAANVEARLLFGLATSDIGRPLRDLEVSYRPVELRSMIEQSALARNPVSERDIEWTVGGELRTFDVQVGPLDSGDGSTVGTGITFIETTRYRRLRDGLEVANERLETAYEELQSTAEELETTNEELQSTNEELETMNEELQSTNEELETMNEELQSTNEELQTINDVLNERTDDLDQVNAFLESILGSLNTAVVVTDDEFAVQAWNAHARELWGLSADEVRGQHFTNLEIGLPLDRVMPLLRAAHAGNGERTEETFESANRRGREFLTRVIASPLRGSDDSARGVILLMHEVERSDGGRAP
jgi:two-component system, chemotaxis family, CheB/CheR fusion protein